MRYFIYPELFITTTAQRDTKTQSFYFKKIKLRNPNIDLKILF